MTRFSLEVSDEGVALVDPSVSPVTTTALALPGGGLLRTDPTSPESLVELRLGGTDPSAPIVRDLVGPVAAGAIAAATSSGSPGTRPVEVEPTTRGPHVMRLALVQWCHEWTPLPVPWWATRLDLGAAAWQAGDVLTAVRVFTEEADRLTSLAQGLLAGIGPVELDHAVREVLDAGVAAVGRAHPSGADWRRLSADLGSRRGAPPPPRQVRPSRSVGWPVRPTRPSSCRSTGTASHPVCWPQTSTPSP